jgi:hypothetical protein
MRPGPFALEYLAFQALFESFFHGLQLRVLFLPPHSAKSQ